MTEHGSIVVMDLEHAKNSTSLPLRPFMLDVKPIANVQQG